jgi:pimeloyl-ACP methyl ester carboxylesterase
MPLMHVRTGSIRTAALLAALLLLTAPLGAQGRRPAQPQGRYARSVLQTGQSAASSAGIGATPAFGATPVATVKRYRTVINGTAAYYYEGTLDPGTGFIEKFLFTVPVPRPTGPRPLLVVFHKFGTSHGDVFFNTTYLQEAIKRGWYLVCPLGAAQSHFSSIEAQVNTEFVLDWMSTHPAFKIDRTRVYGVGFSMGGGSVTNYAARHVDPAHLMLAALIDHSGGVALKDTLLNDPAVQPIFDFWFGNGSAGSADPWKMERSSVINFDNFTLQVEQDRDLARNLMHIPMRIVRASNDTIPYLSRQSDVLHAHMLALGKVPGQGYGYYILPYTGHSWSMLGESAACDWLQQFTLQVPSSGNTLADHDGVYFHFTLAQDQANAFTPFVWNADPPANRLSLSGTGNLKRLTADTAALGLGTGQTLTVDFATADGSGDEVGFSGWPKFPTNVLRDGVAWPAWSYNAVSKLLVLFELDGGAHTWKVIP